MAESGLRPVSLEDAELIEQVRAGRTEAYAALVRKYQDRVFNTCWRICGHLEDARDLTQDAFLKAYESLGEFRHESGFYTWIFRVAVNLSLSHRRKAARRRMMSLDQSGSESGTQAAELARRVGQSSEADPPVQLDETELHGRVVRALQDLDEDHRAVVILRDIEGFDYQAISEILSLATGTVKSRLHRARLALADALKAAARDAV
jgi:RNA polymerase sigma-70 factor (ECF subfamily)